jgi:hypothetical protein
MPCVASLGTVDYGKASTVNSPIIQYQGLNHVYSGKAALSNVNVELDAGEPIGLVGCQWRRENHVAQYPIWILAPHFWLCQVIWLPTWDIGTHR